MLLSRVASTLLVLSMAALVLGWGICILGTSDDGLHCVWAVLATVVAAPLAIICAFVWWRARRRS